MIGALEGFSPDRLCRPLLPGRREGRRRRDGV